MLILCVARAFRKVSNRRFCLSTRSATLGQLNSSKHILRFASFLKCINFEATLDGPVKCCTIHKSKNNKVVPLNMVIRPYTIYFELARSLFAKKTRYQRRDMIYYVLILLFSSSPCIIFQCLSLDKINWTVCILLSMTVSGRKMSYLVCVYCTTFKRRVDDGLGHCRFF